MITVPVPKFNENDLQSAKERKAILDALYALTEQLQRQTTNLDETAFSADFIARLDRLKEAAAAVGALRENTIKVSSALKQEISAKATEIEAEYNRRFEETNEKVELQLTRMTRYESAIGELREDVSAEIKAEADRVTAQFNETIKGPFAQLESISTRITADQNGITINKSDSSAYMQLDNDSITFQQDVTGGVEPLAELSTEGLVTKKIAGTDLSVDTAAVTKSVTVGRFRWVDEGANGFSLVRI